MKKLLCVIILLLYSNMIYAFTIEENTKNYTTDIIDDEDFDYTKLGTLSTDDSFIVTESDSIVETIIDDVIDDVIDYAIITTIIVASGGIAAPYVIPAALALKTASTGLTIAKTAAMAAKTTSKTSTPTSAITTIAIATDIAVAKATTKTAIKDEATDVATDKVTNVVEHVVKDIESNSGKLTKHISNCEFKCDHKKLIANLDMTDSEVLTSAVSLGRITTEQAAKFNALSGVPGYSSTLSKIIGANANKTSGHIFELEQATKRDTISIGTSYYDGIKKAKTDIDLMYKVGNDCVAAELKSYAKTSTIDIKIIKADMDTLLHFTKNNANCKIPAFIFKNHPGNKIVETIKSKGVQVIIDSEVI